MTITPTPEDSPAACGRPAAMARERRAHGAPNPARIVSGPAEKKKGERRGTFTFSSV
jgi:hypothetical protein